MSEPADGIGALVAAARRWGRVEATSRVLSDKLEAERDVREAERDVREAHQEQSDHLARRQRPAVNYHLGEGE